MDTLPVERVTAALKSLHPEYAVFEHTGYIYLEFPAGYLNKLTQAQRNQTSDALREIGYRMPPMGIIRQGYVLKKRCAQMILTVID